VPLVSVLVPDAPPDVPLVLVPGSVVPDVVVPGAVLVDHDPVVSPDAMPW